MQTCKTFAQFILTGKYLFHGLEVGVWKDVNFPPGKGAEPYHVCPYFDHLIEGAKAFGLRREDLVDCQCFCGGHQTSIDTCGILCGRKGTEFTPATICDRIRQALVTAMQCVEAAKNHPLVVEGNTAQITLDLKEMSDERIAQEIGNFGAKMSRLLLTRAIQANLGMENAEVTELIQYLEQQEAAIKAIAHGDGTKHCICQIRPKPDFQGIMF